MWNKIKHIVLFISFCCFSLGMSSQTYPPEPTSVDQKSHETQDCGEGLETSDGSQIPPPVGLCLPINDYLVPLLIVGILFGAYKVKEIQTGAPSSARE